MPDTKLAHRLDALIKERGDAADVRQETITPEMATRWLTQNRHNRTLTEPTVAAYARDMLHGRWALSDSAICFDRDGTLLNGQHRLAACLRATLWAEKPVSFEAVVIRGLPTEAQEVMDQGRPRRVSDILRLRGYTQPNLLHGTARFLMSIKEPILVFAKRITTGEKLEIIERHPHLVDSVKLCQVGGGKNNALQPRGLPPATATGLHYIGTHLLNMPAKADAFVTVLKTGVPAYPGDPVHLLRERVLSHRRTALRLPPRVLHYSAIKAWNAFVRDEPVTKFHPPRNPVDINGLDIDLI